jgi:signal transduction histidine kinase
VVSGRVDDAVLALPEVAGLLCSAAAARACAILSYDSSTSSLRGLAGHGLDRSRIESLRIDLEDLPAPARTPLAAAAEAGRALGFESPACHMFTRDTDGAWVVVLDRPRDPGTSLGAASRVARELHDDVAQSLFSIGSTAKALLGDPALPARLRAPLESTLHLSGTSSRRLRGAIHALRGGPSELELGPALEQLVDEIRVRTGLAIGLDLDPDLRVEGPAAEVIYRVCREALANVERHAGATLCRVEVGAQDGWAVLSVVDDGIGIDDDGGRDHFGLAFVREAVEGLGGELEIGSHHSGGTTLTARVPVD